MSHRGSILCLPSGIHGWRHVDVESGIVTLGALEAVLVEAADIEVLLVGTGEALVPLDPAVRVRCRELGIIAEPMATGAAVRTYNVLLAETRAVAAALLAVA